MQTQMQRWREIFVCMIFIKFIFISLKLREMSLTLTEGLIDLNKNRNVIMKKKKNQHSGFLFLCYMSF